MDRTACGEGGGVKAHKARVLPSWLRKPQVMYFNRYPCNMQGKWTVLVADDHNLFSGS